MGTFIRRTLGSLVLLACAAVALQAQITLRINSTNGSWPTEVGWQVVNTATNVVYHCRPFGSSVIPNGVDISVPAGQYAVRAWDSYGDGWNGASITITHVALNSVLVNAATMTLYSRGSMTCPGPTAVTSTTQTIATFTVVVPCVAPTITSIPATASVCSGTSRTFTVSSNLTNGTYEWRQNGVAVATTTTNSYTIPSINDSHAGVWDVVLRDNCNPTLAVRTSNAWVITVIATPVITQQPVASKATCENTNDVISVRATGAGVTYQWRKNGVNIAGATSADFVLNNVTASANGSYDCVITGTCPPSIVSNACVLTTTERPRTTTEPEPLALCPGASGTLTFAASGTSLNYQWYRNGQRVEGGSSNTLSFTNYSTSMDGQYYCMATSNVSNPNNCIVTVQSRTVTVAGFRPPTVAEQPAKNIDACVGGSATLVAEFAGTGLTFQWYRNGSRLDGAVANSLSLSGIRAADAGSYTCTATGTCGLSVSSDVCVVTVIAKPTLTEQPVNQNLSIGDELRLSVNGTDVRDVQWTRDGKDIPGATSAVYVVEAASLSDAGYYAAKVVNSCGGVVSRAVRVTVSEKRIPQPEIALAQTSADFGTIPVGYTQELDLNGLVSNEGDAALTVTSITIDNSAFTFVTAPTLPMTLAPGESRSLSLRAAPTTQGSISGTMTITSDDPVNPSLTVALSAVYTLRYAHEATLTFPQTDVGQSADLCVRVNNTSSVDIVIDNATITGAAASDFELVTSTPVAIAAGASSDLCLKFTPTASGGRNATVNITSATGGNSSVSISGDGVITTSVADAETFGISASPMPMTDRLNVRFDRSMPDMNVDVMSSSGARVATFAVPAAQAGSTVVWDGRSLSGSDVAAGVYTMIFRTPTAVYTMPIVIVH